MLLRYRDLAGAWRTVSPETLARVLRELDRPADPPDGGPTIAPAGATPGRIRRTPSVVVARQSSGGPFVARLPGRSNRAARPVLWRAEGTDRWRRLRLDNSRPGRIIHPGPLPFGCHGLRVAGAARSERSLLVVTPRGRPRFRAVRRWGIFAPVYALRDERTWGCGDLTALERLGEWAASHGASVLATLPLLPAFLDRPFEPSPYRPVSRRFWNELYLDPRRTPEFARSRSAQRFVRSRAFRRRVAALEGRAYVDFRGAAKLNREVLERMLRTFGSAPPARRAAFGRFVERTEGVREYARFRASFEGDRRRAVLYHLFAQWLVEEQLAAVAERLRARGIDLYFDLPLGVHPDGFDAQRDAGLLARSMSIGSPPDPGVPEGQDWDFPPWNPGHLRDAGYRPWVEAIAHHLRVARLLRIDHALGLHRVFWIPRGRPPSDGAYVRFRPEELYAILVAEASRANAEIVGEDLGTVPRELRPALRRHGLYHLYVAQLEWDGTGSTRALRPDSVASVNTHDHPPFAAYWRERRRGPPSPALRGLLRPREHRSDAFRRVIQRLARSRAGVVLVNLEDLWGERRPQNVPGRSGARMFSRRCRLDLATVQRHGEWNTLLDSIDSLRRGEAGRA